MARNYPADTEADAVLHFYWNDEGTCIIASRDAGGTLHEWGTCEARGIPCRCNPRNP